MKKKNIRVYNNIYIYIYIGGYFSIYIYNWVGLSLGRVFIKPKPGSGFF